MQCIITLLGLLGFIIIRFGMMVIVVVCFPIATAPEHHTVSSDERTNERVNACDGWRRALLLLLNSRRRNRHGYDSSSSKIGIDE